MALPGAAEALSAIDDDRRATTATSCTNRLLTARLAATGLPFPRVIITRHDVRTEAGTRLHLLAAERLGVDPAHARSWRTRGGHRRG